MLCTPTNRTTGDWIRYYDIKEETVKGTRYLTLDQQDTKAKCTEECQTIARSCDEMFEQDIDLDDVSALLWKNKLTHDQFIVSCAQFHMAQFLSDNYLGQGLQ